MSNYITTYSKVHFTPLEPKPEEIRVEDIAHALSLMTRANGHFPRFHSVAQHSIECCEEAMLRGATPRVALACLLHDASEAYMADITRPIKVYLDTYREIEAGLSKAIYQRFLGGLTEEEERQVAAVDDALLYYEFDHFMGEKVLPFQPITKIPTFAPMTFEAAEQRFLELFRELSKTLA
ncbi:MAG: phosphohydrolase [Clostridia bacterium]|nr:phosphohydrolase [Clostridia bacterium]